MKDNIVKRTAHFPYPEFLHRRISSASEESYSVACMCSKCFNVIGIVRRTFTAFAEIKHDIESIDLAKEINHCIDINVYNWMPFKDFQHHCNYCNENTEFFFIDKNLIETIQKLNRIGIKTNFSCEGHTICDIAYISFVNGSDIQYFDAENPLLKSWDIREIEPFMRPKSFGLYVSKENINIKDIVDNKHITDLNEYIDKFIKITKEGDKIEK